MKHKKASDDGPVVIKKYANRRLYDTGRSLYVTLDDLGERVRAGEAFVVEDAKTGEDITRAVLTQIIVEREAGGQPLLPVDFLRQLIRFYGDGMQSVVPEFLDMSMKALMQGKARYDEQIRSASKAAPVNLFEAQMRHNMALFEKTLAAFSPFAAFAPEGGAKPEEPEADKTVRSEDLDELRAQLAAMQDKLDKLG